jgi:hypothetical protein
LATTLQQLITRVKLNEHPVIYCSICKGGFAALLIFMHEKCFSAAQIWKEPFLKTIVEQLKLPG